MAATNPAVIDVTKRAAEDLGFAKSGKAKVKVEVQK
jgi:rare lipoprotein A (peptidoglycan hydrolase)